MKRFILCAALGNRGAAVVGLSAMVPEQIKIDTGVVAASRHRQADRQDIQGNSIRRAAAGRLRWKAPQPAARFDGVFKADAFGPSCTAGGGGGRGRGAAPQHQPRRSAGRPAGQARRGSRHASRPAKTA